MKDLSTHTQNDEREKAKERRNVVGRTRKKNLCHSWTFVHSLRLLFSDSIFRRPILKIQRAHINRPSPRKRMVDGCWKTRNVVHLLERPAKQYHGDGNNAIAHDNKQTRGQRRRKRRRRQQKKNVELSIYMYVYIHTQYK